MKVKEKRIQLLNHSISYYDLNSDKDQTILMIHGNSSSKNSFLPLLEHLQSFRVIAFDLFGHGDSEDAKSDEFYNLPSYSRLTFELAKALNINNFILAGHSLGGHVAIETIPLLEDHLSRVVTWGASPISSVEDLGQAFLPNPVCAPMFKPESSLEELEALAASFIENKNFHKSFIDNYLKSDPQIRVVTFAALAQGKYIDEVEVVKNATVPVTLVYGVKDSILNKEFLYNTYEKIRLENSRVSLKTVSSGHSTQIDSPDVLVKIIQKVESSKSRQCEVLSL